VWRAIERGELPAFRLGEHGAYRIAPEELEAWLQPTTDEETT
jgi:excisionase family DNA binding protein